MIAALYVQNGGAQCQTTHIGEDMDIIDAKPETLAGEPPKWQPTYEDWVYERGNALANADETARAERDAARQQVIDQRAFLEIRALTEPPTGPQCDLRKVKEVGPSSFVVRRCKLADGHDGMCEPA